MPVHAVVLVRMPVEALEVHGTARGLWLTMRRLRSLPTIRPVRVRPCARRKEIDPMIAGLFEPPAALLAWFYSFTHNYILAISMIALVVMIITAPLVLKSTKGMLEMQKLQPEMRKLQQEHRGDRQKLNEEMMKLYQQHKVNPLASCFPLLLQMPVFIIMYRVLHGLQPRRRGRPASPRSTSPTGSQTVPRSLARQARDAGVGPRPGQRPSQAIAESFGKGLIYALLVVTLGVLYYVQQKMVAARAQMAPNMSETQAKLMQYLPVVFAVFLVFYLTGLVIYYMAQAIFRIGLQYYITHRFYKGEHSLGRQAQAAGERGPGDRQEGWRRRWHVRPGQARAERRQADRRPRQAGAEAADSQQAGHSPEESPDVARDHEHGRPRPASRHGPTAHVPRRSKDHHGMGRIHRTHLEEAKDLALDRLGVAADDAEFEVLAEPKPGLFGRLRGEARVRARVRPAQARQKVDRRDRRPRKEAEGGEAAAKPRPGQTAKSHPKPAAKPRQATASTMSRSRGRRRAESTNNPATNQRSNRT